MACAALAAMPVFPARAQSGAPTITDNTDPGFGARGTVEIVASISDFNLGPSGIVVTAGRTFLSFPRHDVDHPGPTLGVWENGKVVPFPSEAMASRRSGAPGDRLVSVHGLTLDAKGRVWAIDDGKVKGHDIPRGGAKVIGFDPRTGAVIGKVILDAALLPDSHMNDLRIDLTHGAQGTAYVADSSFGGHPALVVVDLATGRQRRVLAGDRSTSPDPGYQTVLDGRVLHVDPKHPQFPGGGADGITLSRDSGTLYYSPLSSRRLYSLPTALLSDFSKDDAALAAAVTDEGEKGSADGLASDAWGRIYTTAADHDAVFRRNLDGSFDLIATDPRFVWPDGIFADNRFVYVVLGQWTRLPRFHDGKDLRKTPFLVARMPIQPPQN